MLSFQEYQEQDKNIANTERALIATVMSHPDEMKHADLLLPQDFGFPSHQILWGEILALHRADQLSGIAVVEAVRGKDQFDSIGHEFGQAGHDYLSELSSYAAPQSTAFFGQRVLDKATKRQIRRSAALLAADADSDELDATEILDKVESDILAMRRGQTNKGQSIGNILQLFATATKKRLDGTFVPALVPHVEKVRNILRFYEESDYPIVAARPGDGKSSYMRFEAFNEAINGRPTAIVNLENGELEYARYLVALHTDIDADRLRSPRELTPDELQSVKNAISSLKSAPLTILTMGAPTVQEVCRMMMEAVRGGAKSLWVDYLQLINNRLAGSYDNVSLSSTTLRGFALKHNVPVTAASQLSRNIVHRGTGAEPELSDLRDSGSIEQDATHVIFLRAAWGQNPSEQEIAQFPENRNAQERLIVAPLRAYVRKNRNGSVGVSAPFKWNKSTNRFSNL